MDLFAVFRNYSYLLDCDTNYHGGIFYFTTCLYRNRVNDFDTNAASFDTKVFFAEIILIIPDTGNSCRNPRNLFRIFSYFSELESV